MIFVKMMFAVQDRSILLHKYLLISSTSTFSYLHINHNLVMLIVDVKMKRANANPEHSVVVRGWHSVVLGYPVVLRVVCFVFWTPCGTEGWH